MKSLPFILALVIFFVTVSPSHALDPRLVPNNKVGIHILFPSELSEAARLVNSSGGDWGYITIPMQAGDKDLEKWQKFMHQAKEHHIIPIIRLATEGDYFNTKVWRKPTASDVLDFANFLNSLDWPTKNRYVIVFNEVNRGDEWGGSPNPAEYADILQYAAIVFKNKNQDFFVISSGLDNAAPTKSGQYINQYDFLRFMHQAQPTVFDNLDGLGSHSYPNPGFAQPPTNIGKMSIVSFRYEKELVEQLSGKALPVFITETGWTRDAVPEKIIPGYYKEAFSSAWNDSAVIAVTPFLLRAGGGPFHGFSFVWDNGTSEIYEVVEKLSKIKGEPVLAPPATADSTPSAKVLGTKNFSKERYDLQSETMHIPQSFKTLTKWLLKI